MIDEFTAIVRIDVQQGKVQALTDGLQRLEGPHLRFVRECRGFCPAGGHVSRGERLCVVAGGITVVMGNPIDFDETGLLLGPLRERADWNLMLEQRPWFAACASTQP